MADDDSDSESLAAHVAANPEYSHLPALIEAHNKQHAAAASKNPTMPSSNAKTRNTPALEDGSDVEHLELIGPWQKKADVTEAATDPASSSHAELPNSLIPNDAADSESAWLEQLEADLLQPDPSRQPKKQSKKNSEKLPKSSKSKTIRGKLNYALAKKKKKWTVATSGQASDENSPYLQERDSSSTVNSDDQGHRHLWLAGLAHQHRRSIEQSATARQIFATIAANMIGIFFETPTDATLAELVSLQLRELNPHDHSTREREPFIEALLESEWSHTEWVEVRKKIKFHDQGYLEIARQLRYSPKKKLQDLLLSVINSFMQRRVKTALREYIKRQHATLDVIDWKSVGTDKYEATHLKLTDLLASKPNLVNGLVHITRTVSSILQNVERRARAALEKLLEDINDDTIALVITTVARRTRVRFLGWCVRLSLSSSLFTLLTLPRSLAMPVLLDMNINFEGGDHLKESLAELLGLKLLKAARRAMINDLQAKPIRVHRCLHTWHKGAEAQRPLLLSTGTEFCTVIHDEALKLPENQQNTNCYRPIATAEIYKAELDTLKLESLAGDMCKYLADVAVLKNQTVAEETDKSSSDVQYFRWGEITDASTAKDGAPMNEGLVTLERALDKLVKQKKDEAEVLNIYSGKNILQEALKLLTGIRNFQISSRRRRWGVRDLKAHIAKTEKENTVQKHQPEALRIQLREEQAPMQQTIAPTKIEIPSETETEFEDPGFRMH